METNPPRRRYETLPSSQQSLDDVSPVRTRTEVADGKSNICTRGDLLRKVTVTAITCANVISTYQITPSIVV